MATVASQLWPFLLSTVALSQTRRDGTGIQAGFFDGLKPVFRSGWKILADAILFILFATIRTKRPTPTLPVGREQRTKAAWERTKLYAQLSPFSIEPGKELLGKGQNYTHSFHLFLLSRAKGCLRKSPSPTKKFPQPSLLGRLGKFSLPFAPSLQGGPGWVSYGPRWVFS